MALVYTGDNPITVKISLTLSEASTDQPVLTATSGILTLAKGAKQIQATDLSPIQYTYVGSAITDRDPDGFLIVGSYQACYTLLATDESNGTPLTEDCASFDVEPISPPVLNTPADGDTLETNYPQFSWLPPTPLNLFSNLSYQYTLVQVSGGQSPSDALQQNLPVYINHNCADIFVNYPSSSAALDTGKLYAWQIVAQNNSQPVAQSEIWTFRIAGNGLVLPAVSQDPFVKLRLEQGGGEALCTGAIKFYYSNVLGDSAVSYQVTKVDDNPDNAVIKTGNINLLFGENRITLPFINDSRLLDGAKYLFELTNSNNEVWSMKFMYKELTVTNQ